MKLLKFEADWCSPCRQQNEEFIKHPVKVPVESIDIDEGDPKIILEYNVGSIPKMILFDDNGNKLAEWVGLTESKVINDYIDERKATVD